MRMKTLFMKICCCDSEISDDEEMLVDDEDEDGQSNVIASRNRISRESLTNMWVPGSANNSIQGTPVTSNVQADNEEEQMLKEIIDATRQNIVVIGNTNELAPNNEEIARAKEYENIVKLHDSRLWRLHPPTSSDVDLSGLKDMGDSVFDALSINPLPDVALTSLRATVKQLQDAVNMDMHIEHKQEIIVHMPLDDEVVDDEQ